MTLMAQSTILPQILCLFMHGLDLHVCDPTLCTPLVGVSWKLPLLSLVLWLLYRVANRPGLFSPCVADA